MDYLYLLGQCTSISIMSFKNSLLSLLHDCMPKLIQNSCSGVYLSPGNGGSGPFLLTYDL